MTTISDPDLSSFDVGDEIPSFSIPLTVQRLVMETAANRDLAPIHHNDAVAQAQGAPRMFANTLFLAAMYEATAREWAGLRAKIERITFRMLKFNCAGEVVDCKAKVRSRSNGADGTRVELEMWTETGNGMTSSGTLVVHVPAA